MLEWRMRIDAVIPANFLFFVATVGLILSAVRIMHMFRARAIRAFAARWGLQYIGPPAPPKWWWNPAHFEIQPPLPGWISHFHPSGRRIRQAWNVIEGQQNGISIMILDTVIGEYRGGQACTLFACHTEKNPFGASTSADRVVQSHGWTVLHGAWFLWFSWTMSTKRLDGHMNALRAPQNARSE
jgi:hypothetical protein